MKQLLWYLIAGTRGGESRAKIVNSIRKKPANANQLSKSLELDYKTILHHLGILTENNIIMALKKGSYGAVYFLSVDMEKNIGYFDEIWNKFGNK